MTNTQFKQRKPPTDALERTRDKALADWRKVQEEKARVIAAMLAAGQQAREAAK